MPAIYSIASGNRQGKIASQGSDHWLTLDEAETSCNEKPETWPGRLYRAQSVRTGRAEAKIGCIHGLQGAELTGWPSQVWCMGETGSGSQRRAKEPGGVE